MRNLPVYLCHKRVQAAPIANVDGNHLTIRLPDGGLDVVEVSPLLFARYTPTPGDYLVIYEDGYQAISPKEVFEEGYRPVSAAEAAA